VLADLSYLYIACVSAGAE